jgi:acetyltransferase-like isoleucine patch superfamily enzyme
MTQSLLITLDRAMSDPNNTSPALSPMGAPSTAQPSPTGDRRGTGHGMMHAGKVRSRWGVAWRHIIMVLISKLPGTPFKSKLIAKLLGVKVGRDVGIAYGVFLDPYDPTLISFGDNVIVGFETRIFVHMFTLNRQRVKPVKIGSNVMIGGFCVIAPGVTIGDGASIAPGTIVSRSVSAGAIVMGMEMRIRKRGAPAPGAAAKSEVTSDE